MKFTLQKLLKFMILSIESGYYSHDYFIHLIDSHITNYDSYPYIFNDLSCSKNSEKFVSIIWESNIIKDFEDFNNFLVGFIINSYKDGKIINDRFRCKMIDIFDGQPMDFAVETLSDYFESTNKNHALKAFLDKFERQANVDIKSFDFYQLTDSCLS